jgi:NAD(P) transhydrogenase
MAYIASSVSCILALAGLAKQSTARIGNSLGCLGVGMGVFATLGYMDYPLPLLVQWMALVGLGGGLGATIAQRVAITDLPQLVAMFHSFVGLAAVLTSIGNWMEHFPHLATDP